MQVADFVNKHEGCLGFVVGSAPSLYYDGMLNKLPLLKDYVVMTVNAGCAALKNFDYFCGDDYGLRWWRYYQELLAEHPCIKFLYKAKLKDAISHFKEEEVVLFDHKPWFVPSENKYYKSGLVFTKEEPLLGARSVMGTAIHLLYLMSCDPIVLLGADACYSKDRKRYFWQYFTPELQKQLCMERSTGEKAFCFPNHGWIDGYPVDSHSTAFIEYFDKLAVQCKKQNVNIINASGGVLDCFPRMSLTEVLEKYGDRKKQK